MTKVGYATSIRILLIEDDMAQAMLLQRQLTQHEGDVTVVVERAASLTEGLTLLEGEEFDAALVDLNLPETYGAQTITSVLRVAPHLPIIALSMNDDRETAIASLRKGAVDYIIKTDTTSDLLVRALRYAIERKRQQDAMNRHAHELQRSNQELEEFAHVVSHELKTPLWVLGYAIEMVSEELSEKFSADLQKVMKGAQSAVSQAREVIDKLLEYAKVNYRGGPPSPVDATESLRKAIEALQMSIQTTATKVSHGQLPSVLANENMLAHVFRNLIENAINYRADRPQEITIDAAASGTHWVFRVTDRGAGIDPLAVPRIFKLFERGGQKGSGTGVGLAICKRIVELHGGRIWVESRLGEGSTFFFTLPGCNGRTASPAVVAQAAQEA